MHIDKELSAKLFKSRMKISLKKLFLSSLFSLFLIVFIRYASLAENSYIKSIPYTSLLAQNYKFFNLALIFFIVGPVLIYIIDRYVLNWLGMNIIYFFYSIWQYLKKDLVQNEEFQEEKIKFLKITNINFKYVNKNKINNYYIDYYNDKIRIESIETTECDGIESTLGNGSLKIGGKKGSTTIKRGKPVELSLEGKFLKYQKDIIRDNSILLGVENCEVDMTKLEKFKSILTKLIDEYKMVIDENEINRVEELLKKEAATNTIKRIEDASGIILMDGRFKIEEEKNTNDIAYKFIYRHPVNNYDEKGIIFTFILKKDSLIIDFKEAIERVKGTEIPLRIFGEVFRTISVKDNIYELIMIPFAVF